MLLGLDERLGQGKDPLAFAVRHESVNLWQWVNLYFKFARSDGTFTLPDDPLLRAPKAEVLERYLPGRRFRQRWHRVPRSGGRL